jgi:cyclophilin family peptidyl-prolyl cis-trans isomerase|tara:strand:- start:614 stop:1258 length:645 start_codon:yes stop_codon:yes gene_type:complete
MIKKIKQTLSEKILLLFLLILAITTFSFFITIKNKCLFVKNYNPKKINFEKPENIAVLNAPCGNVIIELYPKISPNSVKRFKMLINNNEYNNVAFHRVIKNVLVQAGDLEFGKKNNLNYIYIGTGKSKYENINSELDSNFDFKKGSVALARESEKNTEDSQFFILLQDAPLFEGEYSPVGKVIYGLEVLNKIKYNEKSEYVLRPDFINTFKMFK